jgi:predicted small metal-binding protein
MNCTVAISADTKEELLDAAVQHAVAVHGHHDSPQLREELVKMIKTSRATAPSQERLSGRSWIKPQ